MAFGQALDFPQAEVDLIDHLIVGDPTVMGRGGVNLIEKSADIGYRAQFRRKNRARFIGSAGPLIDQRLVLIELFAVIGELFQKERIRFQGRLF